MEPYLNIEEMKDCANTTSSKCIMTRGWVGAITGVLKSYMLIIYSFFVDKEANSIYLRERFGSFQTEILRKTCWQVKILKWDWEENISIFNKSTIYIERT